MFCTFSERWRDARNFCYDYGYHMLAINSAPENFWADGISDSYSQEKWWTGLNIASEGTFVWRTATSSTTPTGTR